MCVAHQAEMSDLALEDVRTEFGPLCKCAVCLPFQVPLAANGHRLLCAPYSAAKSTGFCGTLFGAKSGRRGYHLRDSVISKCWLSSRTPRGTLSAEHLVFSTLAAQFCAKTIPHFCGCVLNTQTLATGWVLLQDALLPPLLQGKIRPRKCSSGLQHVAHRRISVARH